MSAFNRLWSNLKRFVEALDDDPMGSYLFSLEKRIEKLERDLRCLEGQSHPRPDGGAVAVHATADGIQ
jgi:hypothetical protein